MMSIRKIKTRFAPSPTGKLHIGGVKAALLPYIFSRKNEGKFLLRIDDTDKERSKNEYVEDILNNLKWLNIHYDETFKQSDRVHIYDEIFYLLKEHNFIYECFETQDELENIKTIKKIQKKAPIFTINDRIANHGESYWRFNIIGNTFILKDLIQGEMKFGKEWSDPIIKKPDGGYTYVFASVVDDVESEITHIIRGEEHISNAIIQKLIGDTICKLKYKKDHWDIEFAHFSLFLDADGSKISKRNLNNNLESLKYIEPITFWSILTSLGTNQNQLFSLNYDDYIKNFDLNHFSTSKQKFSFDIIDKTNRKIFHLQNCPHGYNNNIWLLIKDNCENINEFKTMNNNLISFISKNSELKSYIVNGKNIDDLSLLFNLDKKSTFKYIYNHILSSDFGPNVNDLFEFIRNNH